MLQFGQTIRVVEQPGLQFKIPLFQNVILYSKKVLEFEPPPQQVTASDQKRLVVDSFVRYRIADPLKFYQSVGTEEAMTQSLGVVLNGALRRVIGNIVLSRLLSPERGQIMGQIKDSIAAEAQSLRPRRDRRPYPAGRSAPREQPGDLSAHAVGTQPRGQAIPGRGALRLRPASRRVPTRRSPLSGPTRTSRRRSCAARAMPTAPSSMPTPMARIRSSSTSTGRCRPIARLLPATTRPWCCRPTAISCAT